MMYDHHTIMYDDVWCCVMYRLNPKTRVWTYGAWGEGGVQHGKLRRVTQHLDRLRRCLRFRFCQGVRLRVGESKVTWKKDLNTTFDSHHTSTHVITSTHIDKDGISQFTPSRNHKIWEKQGKKCKPENNTTRKPKGESTVSLTQVSNGGVYNPQIRITWVWEHHSCQTCEVVKTEIFQSVDICFAEDQTLPTRPQWDRLSCKKRKIY